MVTCCAVGRVQKGLEEDCAGARRAQATARQSGCQPLGTADEERRRRSFRTAPESWPVHLAVERARASAEGHRTVSIGPGTSARRRGGHDMSQHAPSDRVDAHTGFDLRRNRPDDGVEVAASRLDLEAEWGTEAIAGGDFRC